ncbi:MAG: right-handed parallel beta-helix repeat-containing protein [Phycisphaerales bacterium]
MNRFRSVTLARIGVLFLAHSLGSAFVAADIIEVPGDYPTIQEAIDAAVDGDEVHVASGTWYEAIDFLGKSIRVFGANPHRRTIIDGTFENRSVVTFQSNEPRGAVLEHCTIRYGSGTLEKIANGHERWGGGLLIRSAARPTIIDCRIERNATDRGGGVMVAEDADPIFRDVTFSENVVWGTRIGAGARVDEGAAAQFIRCSFTQNTAGSGGGLGVYHARVQVKDCSFVGNTATGEGGGAIRHISPFPLEIEGSSFRGNIALRNSSQKGQGGAIMTISPLSVRLSEFIENLADEGGAISFSRTRGPITVEQCTFRANGATENAGAVHVSSTAEGITIRFCEFVENSAPRGGAQHGKIRVEDSSFVRNRATENGGACIYAGEFIRCYFEGNTATELGGAVFVADSIQDCHFESNRADARGGALSSIRYPNVDRCVFVGNRAPIGGAVDEAHSVKNSLFLDNVADRGAAVAGDGTAIILCTFSRNRAIEGEVIFDDRSVTLLASSILWDNDGAAVGPLGSEFVVEDCIIEGGVPWMDEYFVTILTEDPQFVDPAADDFSLRPDSPAIDWGSPYYLTSFDLAGLPRRVGPFPDIGAYEFQANDRGFAIREPGPFTGRSGEIPFGGARPGDRVYFAYSFQTGREKVSICPGVFTDLEAPVGIGTSVADEQGAGFSPSRVVREAARGRVMYFQALNLDTCEVSNLVSQYFR